jgi:hypothetical protein
MKGGVSGGPEWAQGLKGTDSFTSDGKRLKVKLTDGGVGEVSQAGDKFTAITTEMRYGHLQPGSYSEHDTAQAAVDSLGGKIPRPKKSDPVLDQWSESRKRTEPGKGAELKDDGVPGSKSIKIRSIPNVSTERLKRRSEHIERIINTPEGLHSFDEPRRTLIHLGVNNLAIKHELRLRGEA